jgi:hypothetical protein
MGERGSEDRSGSHSWERCDQDGLADADAGRQRQDEEP